MAQTPEGPATRPGALIFIAGFLAFSVFLLSQLGAETKWASKAQLFTQPRFWPGVGVICMVVCGALHLTLGWRDKVGWATGEVLVWIKAVEYLVWYLVYVTLVPVIGYLAATVLFTVLLALRQGYRGAWQMGAAVALGMAIVLVFKTGLSVKIPGGAVYEYLPGALRNFMILNF